VNYERNHRAVDYDEAVSNAPCSDRPEPLVDAVIAAYEALVSAQDKVAALQDAWQANYDATASERGVPFLGYTAGRRKSSKIKAQLTSSEQSVDKARDDVMAAVAALAGRKR
jgi:hypothetical protein